VSCSAWSDVLKGSVRDLGAPSSSNGIAGVTLSVRDANNTEMASGLTDGQGEYTVSYTGQKVGVRVIYEKLGFQPRPTVRSVVDTKSPQKPVLLLREGAREEYYKLAAATLANEAGNVSSDYLHDSAMSVAALPATDKAQVLQYLKDAPAEKVLAAIRTEEENKFVAMQVKAAIFNDASVNSSGINVETLNGKVLLSGFAKSGDEANKAVKAAREVKGVASVKNDIRVIK